MKEKHRQYGAGKYDKGIYFFILTEQKRGFLPKTIDGFAALVPGFDPRRHIITLVDVCGGTKNLYTDAPERFRQVRDLLARERSNFPFPEQPGQEAPFERSDDLCPFKGLPGFEEHDHPFCFGREAQADELLDRLQSRRFLALLGPSGSGKTFVVRAGVLPLIGDEAVTAVMTPGVRPLEQLLFALRPCFPAHDRPSVKDLKRDLSHDTGLDTLHLLGRQILAGGGKQKLVLAIDQLEELFLRSDRAGRLHFLELIFDALALEGGCVSVIITMRSDFLGHCAPYDRINHHVTHQSLQLQPLKPDQLRRAVEEPARLRGHEFGEGLIRRILEDAAGASAELPLVQHALYELYHQGKGRVLTFTDYHAVGGVKGALLKRAEAEYNKLSPLEQEILRKLFVLRMAHPGEGTEDTRRRADKADLLAVGDDAEAMEGVLAAWIDARLLTSAKAGADGVMVEAAHEALIRQWTRLRGWMDEDREAARLIVMLQQQMEEWEVDFSRLSLCGGFGIGELVSIIYFFCYNVIMKSGIHKT